jgi:CRP/FNR family transcriptional regulator
MRIKNFVLLGGRANVRQIWADGSRGNRGRQEQILESLAEKALFDTVFGRIETSPRGLSCNHKAAPGLALECQECEIKGLSVCDSLEPDEFELLERIGRTLSFPAKASLFEQGRDAPFVSNVTSGALRLSKLLPDGRRQVVGFALPGDFLGLMSLPRMR